MSQSDTTTRAISKIVYDGVAAEDIEDNSIVLKVICPELIPHAATGSVGAGITSTTTKLQNRDGTPITVPYTSANHIVATWEGASNMRYPPLVKKGEPVEIYKVANQDKYYWRSTGRGREYRKTDRIAFEIAAMSASDQGGEKTDDNTYSAYLDSVNKKAGFRTSKANGEAVAFKCEMDLATGTFTISDDSDSPGNRIYLDAGTSTGNPIFQVNLSTGLTLKFENENAMITVPKKLLINAGERIVFNSPLTIFNMSQVGAILLNAANIAINGAKDVIVGGSVFGVNTASSKIGGVLVAAAGRIASLVKGPAGSSFTATTVSRPEESPTNPGSNSPDTDMSGTPYQS